MIRAKKKLTVLLMATAIIILSSLIVLSNVTSSLAYVSDNEYIYLKQLNDTFRNNINNMDDYDTNSGNKWEMPIDSKIALNKKEAMRFLQGVYAVVPFFNAMTVKSSIGNYKISLENMSKYESAEVVKVAKKWIGEVVSDDMTDIEKIKAIHDKIVNETAYDDSNGDEAHSPAGVAIERKAVCDGYSRMFAIMLTMIDIPVVQVTSGTMDHAFNLVYVNGEWLLVDATYNDPVVSNGQVLRHDYFMINPASSKRHVYDSDENGLTLKDYIDIGNYIYKDEIAKTKKVA